MLKLLTFCIVNFQVVHLKNIKTNSLKDSGK